MNVQMSPKPVVEVFILCYNRVNFVGDAIRSVLAQTYAPLRIILSDNSTKDDVSLYLSEEFPQLEVRRRSPSQSNYDHLNTVLVEATAPYFMIFHDDDVLSPTYIETLVREMEKNPALSCACANAYFRYGNTPSKRRVNPSLKTDMILDAKTLASRYLDHAAGINPFPGYLYRLNAIQNLRFNFSEARLYSDFTFLTKVAYRGPVLWVSSPLMEYRRHLGNESNTIDLKAAKLMVNFLACHRVLPKNSSLLRKFRYWNHLFFLRNRWRMGQPLRHRQLRLVTRYFLFHPVSLLKKALQKLSFR